MTKKLFVESIEAIKKQRAHDDRCVKAFDVILPEDRVVGYDNHILVDQIVKILQTELDDLGNNSWIEYFMWELNFGKDWTPKSCSEINGKTIDISTSSKLYDWLENEKQIKKKSSK